MLILVKFLLNLVNFTQSPPFVCKGTLIVYLYLRQLQSYLVLACNHLLVSISKRNHVSHFPSCRACAFGDIFVVTDPHPVNQIKSS